MKIGRSLFLDHHLAVGAVELEREDLSVVLKVESGWEWSPLRFHLETLAKLVSDTVSGAHEFRVLIVDNLVCVVGRIGPVGEISLFGKFVGDIEFV